MTSITETIVVSSVTDDAVMAWEARQKLELLDEAKALSRRMQTLEGMFVEAADIMKTSPRSDSCLIECEAFSQIAAQTLPQITGMTML